MPFTTKRQGLILTADEKEKLESSRRSRSGPKRETLRAGILLDLNLFLFQGLHEGLPAAL
jgi:hypothetical protein